MWSHLIRRPRLTNDFAPPAPARQSRHVLAPSEHPVTHALRDVDDAVSAMWCSDLAAYDAARAELATLAAGAPNAEALLRQAAGFISRASNHLASLRCSCRIPGWVHAETVSLHTEAVRLLGATAAVVYAPRWSPLS